MGGDLRSGVGHPEPGVVRVGDGADVRGAARMVAVDRIVDQVLRQPVQGVFGSPEVGAEWSATSRYAEGHGGRLVGARDAASDGGEVHGLAVVEATLAAGKVSKASRNQTALATPPGARTRTSSSVNSGTSADTAALGCASPTGSRAALAGTRQGSGERRSIAAVIEWSSAIAREMSRVECAPSRTGLPGAAWIIRDVRIMARRISRLDRSARRRSRMQF